jgi:drug/metabolite transporter (DMT)-like permease
VPWAALVTVYLVWGSTYLGIRVAVGTIPPYVMTGFRYVVAGVALFALQWLVTRTKPSLPNRRDVFQIVIVAALLLCIGNGLLCVAETRVESGTSALLLASTPIFMVLLDAFRSRKMPAPSAICGIAIGTAGIAALVGKGAGNVDVWTAGMILIGAFSWAFGSVYARGRKLGPYTASFEMVAGGILCSIVAVAIGEPAQLHIHAVTGASLWGLLWLITGGAMLGYSAFAYAVRTLPTATVATYGYVNPVVAVILGALVLREPLTWNVLAGGAAVIVSVVLILLGNRRQVSTAALSS